MADIDNQRDFIIRVIAETKGFKDALRETTHLEKQIKASSDKLQQYYAPTGKGSQFRDPSSGQFMSTSGRTSVLRGETSKIASAYVQDLNLQYKKGELSASAYNKQIRALNDTFGTHVRTLDITKQKYSDLIVRAAQVIPIWLALRGVYMGLMNTFQMGVKHIVDFDKAMAQVRNVVDDVDNLDVFVKNLRENISQLATETGKSAGEITMAFYAMKDSGLSTELALAGMNTSVKASVAFWTDTEKTAKTLADVYTLMGDRITEVSTAQDKMNYIMASVGVLQQKNKFTMDQMQESLRTFTSSAQAAGLTMDQLLFTLAKSSTYMQRGSRGGTQMARAFQELDKNIDKVRVLLPDITNPREINKFVLFTKVLEELNARFLRTGDITTEVSSVFGTIGKRSINAFITEFQAFMAEMKEFENTPFGDRMNKLADMYKNSANALQTQIDRISRLREQIGEQFIIGFTGTDDFESALKRVAAVMENILKNTQSFATVIKSLGPSVAALAVSNPILAPIAAVGGAATGMSFLGADLIQKNATTKAANADYLNKAVTGQLDIKDVIEMRRQLESGFSINRDGNRFRPEDFGLETKQIIEALSTVIKKQQVDLGNITVTAKKSLEVEESKVQVNGDLTNQLEYQEVMLKRMLSMGYSEIDVEKKLLELMVQRGVDEDKRLAQRIKIIEMMNSEVIKLSETLKSSLNDSLSDFLKGQSSVAGFFTKIGNTTRDTFFKQVSSGLTDRLFKSTALGDVFGSSMMNIKNVLSGEGSDPASRIKSSFVVGSKLTYDMIVKGFKDSDLKKEDEDITAAGSGSTQYKQNFLRTLSLGVESGLLAFSQYQNARQQGVTKGYAGASAGLTSIGNILMNSPETEALGGTLSLAGILLSLFGKKEKDIEEVVTEKKVTSRIDVTNKNLEIINRNLLALKSSVETYILPSTAYFSAKRNIEDQWVLMSSRGFLG